MMTREDLYEAAVRAVLDLCDKAQVTGGYRSYGGLMNPSEVRAAIGAALRQGQE